MCGIIGIIAKEKDINGKILGNVLRDISYRGYDSQGIYLNRKETNSEIKKTLGTFSEEDLENILKKNINLGLAHTRWATSGEVSTKNAHPHYDKNKRFYVVMNGIIENENEIRTELSSKGIEAHSSCDTALIPYLFQEKFDTNLVSDIDFLRTSAKIFDKIKGDFAILLVDDFAKKILGYKRGSNPLHIAETSNSYLLCSDLNSIQNYSKRFISLQSNNFILLNNGVQ